MMKYRSFRTDSKLRLLTKIDFNVMNLVTLCKKFAENCNSWLTGHPKFSTIPGLNFGATASGNPDMYFL